MKLVFSTNHFDVYRYSSRDSEKPRNTFHIYVVVWAGTSAQNGAVCIVKIRASRRKTTDGCWQIIWLYALSQPDWTSGEIAYEVLIGIRDFVGPLSFDLIEAVRVDAVCAPARLDEIVPPTIRDRLRLSMVDDTWNQLAVNELAAI